jgi:hypothetical protein
MMFRTVPAIEAPVVMDPADLIPLSHLSLDLPVPAAGWLIELERRGIEVVVDDIGRRSVARDVARMLIAEQAEAEMRRREVMARVELAAEEKDRQFRAQLHPGIPWHRMPDPGGLLPVMQMTAAAKDAQPRRTPSQNEWLFGEVDDTMVYHELPQEES